MADNTVQTATDTIATDDVTTLNGGASSGIKVQRVKVLYGDDNTARDVSPSFPLPVAQRDVNTSRSPLIGTFQALNAVPLIGLVNSTFYLTTSITDNYTTANTGTATTTVTANDGFAVLACGTTNPSTAQITSKDFATYNGIGELMFLNGLRAPQAGVAGCIRRWGPYDSNNGYFFADNAGTFQVVSRKGGVDTVIAASGAFNGLMGTTYVLDQNAHFFQVLMTGGRAVFMIDQTVLHIATPPAGTTTTSGSLNLPIRVEVISTQTANMTLELRGQNIGRLGTVDSKRLNEGILDATDAELTRAVLAATTGAANTYVNLVAKPASTAAVATDTALVVAHHPSSPTPAGTAAIGTVGANTAATGTGTQPALAVTSFTVLAANTARKGAFVFNDSTNLVYLGLFATTSATVHTVQIVAGGYYELPSAGFIYTGIITAISGTASGSLRVTELS